MRTVDVACAADSRYLAHCAAMLHSVMDAEGPDQVHAHLLHAADLSPRRLATLERMVADAGACITSHLIEPNRVAGLPEWGRIPATMWYRIFLPELLPAVDRVLYLDVDTIVVDTLAPLWDLDLSDSYVAAVTNVPERHMLDHAQQLGLAGPRQYFNSGVLLMNLELMRRDGCSAALRDLALTRRDELLWPDQDALNLVLGARRIDLHPRWNLMNSIRAFPWSAELLGEREVREAIADPAILHFEGPRENKPWHLLCDHPMRDVYFRHRRATPWHRFPRRGFTPGNLARFVARSTR